MESEKTPAIILKVVDFSETSCVVTLFTRSHGKITALAKGARRPKGPFESAIDVLAICDVVFLHKRSQAMDLLTEAKLQRRFRSSSRDLQRLYCGYYVAELLRLLTDEADPHPEVFDLALSTVKAVDGEAQVSEAVFGFECGVLELLGHSPMLTRCAVCGKNKTAIDRVHFGLIDGGLMCPECCRGRSHVKLLDADCLQFLLDQFGVTLEEGSTSGNPREIGGAGDSGRSEPLFRSRKGYLQARELMNQYLNNVVGHEIRLQKYLENL